MRKNFISIGNCGEYFVAAELERRGFSVAVPMKNTPFFDLLAMHQKSKSLISIQVKTTSEEKVRWRLNKKAEQYEDKNMFYIFVKLNDQEQPDYYIIPSGIVCKTIREEHLKWLNTPGKKGQKHNDNNMRVFAIEDIDKYKNAWESLLELNIN